jgi:hypothetical protein
MSTMSMSPEAAAYLAALRGELSDLTPEELEEVLADVEVSVVEASMEGEGALAEQLGAPASFAAELRAAAGLPANRPAATPGQPFTARFEELLRSMRQDPRLARFLRVLHDLAPVWWIVRAYIAAGALAMAGVGGWSTLHPMIPRFGDGPSTAVVLLVLLTVSVWLGMRAREAEPRAAVARASRAASVLLVITAVPVLIHLSNSWTPVPQYGYAYSEPIATLTPAPAGLTNNGLQVQNLYAFSRDGGPLFDVLLYDQDGRPVSIGSAASLDPNRRVLVSSRGAQLFNSFPIRYYDPGTRVISHPRLTPRARAPHVVTARLPHKP